MVKRDAQRRRARARGERERLGRRREPGGVAGHVAGEQVEQLRGLGDRARQHAVDDERRGAEVGRRRDAVALRLQADQPAARGRDPQRAAAVVAVGERDHAGRDRGRRAAGRAARRARRGPTGCAPGRRARGSVTGQDPELGELRRADDHEAGGAQAARPRCGRSGATKSRISAQPCVRRRPRAARLFLIAIGTPANGRGSPGRDRGRRGERALGVDLDEGAEPAGRAPRSARATASTSSLAHSSPERTSAASSAGLRNIRSSAIGCAGYPAAPRPGLPGVTASFAIE